VVVATVVAVTTGLLAARLRRGVATVVVSQLAVPVLRLLVTSTTAAVTIRSSEQVGRLA